MKTIVISSYRSIYRASLEVLKAGQQLKFFGGNTCLVIFYLSFDFRDEPDQNHVEMQERVRALMDSLRQLFTRGFGGESAHEGDDDATN